MFGLPEATKNAMNAVFERHPEIRRVVIYGSRAKGTQRRGSDIDLTLQGKGVDDRVLSQVQVGLDDLNTPYLMDVSIFDEITSQALREHIQRVGRVFYAADDS
ncbi:MAG: nucleotidyltransferase domain-containing protein [Hydrogenovibrio sp.]|uniref:nucleotidyltransferase domain-containing protein n=1 Tax=Hydrogenovibrio sp. TaxID=2065821 RepID=UPI00286FDD10|nr:nucleotidyltransferase domain-containing protein [Hydrogenovibrio sp.]MDR9498542.1 nucleotidyltransferase domain-containing protein [Hydrogenovibrio sp.]MDR9499228.1 nucleotidyltransferase domain-containing protein [Hydrogenovibrio sp.]